MCVLRHSLLSILIFPPHYIIVDLFFHNRSAYSNSKYHHTLIIVKAKQIQDQHTLIALTNSMVLFFIHSFQQFPCHDLFFLLNDNRVKLFCQYPFANALAGFFHSAAQLNELYQLCDIFFIFFFFASYMCF